MSSAKQSLGVLPGEPKKRPKIAPSLVQALAPAPPPVTDAAPAPAITKLSAKDVKTLMGKGAYPVTLDLRGPAFNLEDDSFLKSAANVIKFLDLSGNSLMELENLTHLSKLKTLYVERNVLTNVSFRGLVGLELLSLKHNRLETLGDMGDLKKAVNIDLGNNRIVEGFSELSKVKSLRVLDLSQNKIDMSLPEFHHTVVEHLKKLPKLEYLSFEGNPIESAILDFRCYIAQELPKLRFLDWTAVTKEERTKGQRLDEQRAWESKNMAFNAASASTRKLSSKQEPAATANPKRLSTALECILSEIDELGLDAGPPPLRPYAGGSSGTPVVITTTAAQDKQMDKYIDELDAVVEKAQEPPPTMPAAATATSAGGAAAETPASPAQAPGALVDMMHEMIAEEQKPPQPAGQVDALAALISSIADVDDKLADLSVEKPPEQQQQAPPSPLVVTPMSPKPPAGRAPSAPSSPAPVPRAKSGALPPAMPAPTPPRSPTSPQTATIELKATVPRRPSPKVETIPQEQEKPSPSLGTLAEPWKFSFGDIVLKERLGEGALGETFRCAPFRKRQVTVKRLRPQRFHPAFIEEFSAEVLRCSSLRSHPHIVPLIAGSFEGVISFACEYVPGLSLAEYVKGLHKRESLEARLAIAKGIAAGLKFLHDNGVAHGTLKPSDVVLASDLTPRIRDFGFCHIKQVNLSEGALFTPQYMPPEAFDETIGGFDSRADVYSFGILLWELFEGCLTSGNSRIQEPAPQDGVPLKLTFDNTPNEIADVVTRCCSIDPTARPDLCQVMAMLNLPSADVLKFFEAQLDPATKEKKLKLHIIAAKIADLFAAPSDYAPLKALEGIRALLKSEENRDAIVDEKLYLPVIEALGSSYENVVEKSIRVLTELAEVPKFLPEVAAAATPETVMGLFYERNDVITMLALRLVAVLFKDTVARENFFNKKVITPLINHLSSGNDFVVTNASWACSRLLKIPEARNAFFACGGVSVMLRLVFGNNPAAIVHVLTSLAYMLSHEPAQDVILKEGIANRFFMMLGNRSELLQFHALKSVVKFSQSARLLENVNVGEWVVAVRRHLQQGSSPQILTRACQALANLAYNDEECDRLESLGTIPLIIDFISSKNPVEKLQAQALNLLARLLRCGSCRDTFRDAEGLSPLAKLFLNSTHNPKLQYACLLVFLELSSDESAADAIADAGVITAVVLQMTAAGARGDAKRLHTTLQLVRALSQGPENATEPIRQAGAVEKLLQYIDVCPVRDLSHAVVIHEAGLALASLIREEEVLQIVAASPKGLATLFSLFYFPDAEVQSAVMLQFSIHARQRLLIRTNTTTTANIKLTLNCSAELAELFIRNGFLQHVAKMLVTGSVAMQSLSLKVAIFLSQEKKRFRDDLAKSGVLDALGKVAEGAPQPTLRAAAAKAKELLA